MQHPLSSAGLAIALATECSGYARAVNINALTVSIDLEGDVKRLLGPLIRLQPKIGLSHQSVKDHFLRTLNELEPASPYAIDKSRSHARVALICLRYLNSPDHRFNGGTAEKKNDFLKYALKFAPVHIALGCKNEDMFAEQIELFFRQQVWTKSWEQVLKPELDTGSPPWMPDCTSAISLACRLNLPKLLSRQFTAMSTEKRSDYARRHSVELRCIWLYEALASRNERCLMPILCNVQITVFPPQILQSLFDSALDPLPDLVYNWPKSTTSDFPVVYGARKKRFIRCALQMADIQERLDTGFVVKDQRFSELREYSNIEDRILRAYRTLNVSTEALTSGPMHSPTQTSSMMQLALLLCIFLKSPRLFSLYQKYEHVLALTPAFRANFIEEPLFSAESIAVLQMAQQGNFSVVKALVQEGAGLVARDPNNASVLHWAARSGNPDFVEYVLAIDPTDINSKDARGMTPLHYACTQNHLWDNQLFADSRPEAVSRSKVVKRLLAAGALRQARDTQGNTPLQVLSRVYIPDWSEVPRDSDLLWRGDDLRECLEMLIEGVSDIMQWDSYKTTIMHYAAYFWPVAAVQYLVDNLEALSLPVTLVDHKGFSPMHYAVIRPFDDSVQVIELLARAGVDVRAGGRQGMDAFAIAKRYGKLQALEKLIAVKEAQAFARTKAFQSLLFDTWTELERRKQRGPDAMIQTFLNQHSMSHIPIGPTPLLGFLRFPQAIQPYLNHPSTEVSLNIILVRLDH
jgi:ankyrin repeat protein